MPSPFAFMKGISMKGLRERYKKDFRQQKMIDAIDKTKPYVDTTTGVVYWGTDSGKRKKEKG